MVANFSNDYWWVSAIKAVCILAFLLLSVLFALWFERRVIARMQLRLGPNVRGPLGLFQAVFDALKLILKEDVITKRADIVIYLVAPVISVFSALMAFAVIPLGSKVRIPFTSFTTPLQLTDFSVSVLYILAVMSLGVYGIALGGWSSRSTYSLYGSVRGSAQIISYELSMGVAILTTVIFSGTLSTSGIVNAQKSLWYAVGLFPSLIIYIISMFGETNRLPFDLPEAEGELVSGYITEYSSMKFAWFFLAEYINMINVSAVCTTLFLGGWHAPFPFNLIAHGALDTGWWTIVWFLIKVWAMMFLFVWVRATIVRYRYDQFMHLGWKILVPISFVWLALVTVIKGITSFSPSVFKNFNTTPFIIGVIVLCLIVIFWPEKKKRPNNDISENTPNSLSTSTPSSLAWITKDLLKDPSVAQSVALPPTTYRKAPTGIKAIISPIAGFGVTLRTFFSKPITEQYPKEKIPPKLRFHGRHQLNRFEDGLEKCVGCELCAWACPAGAIKVNACENTKENRVSHGQRYAKDYQINYLRCIFCGYCIEACPTRALTMTNEFDELVAGNRKDLIWEKDKLLVSIKKAKEKE